jgi:hypothetical protein
MLIIDHVPLGDAGLFNVNPIVAPIVALIVAPIVVPIGPRRRRSGCSANFLSASFPAPTFLATSFPAVKLPVEGQVTSAKNTEWPEFYTDVCFFKIRNSPDCLPVQ